MRNHFVFAFASVNLDSGFVFCERESRDGTPPWQLFWDSRFTATTRVARSLRNLQSPPMLIFPCGHEPMELKMAQAMFMLFATALQQKHVLLSFNAAAAKRLKVTYDREGTMPAGLKAEGDSLAAEMTREARDGGGGLTLDVAGEYSDRFDRGLILWRFIKQLAASPGWAARQTEPWWNYLVASHATQAIALRPTSEAPKAFRS